MKRFINILMVAMIAAVGCDLDMEPHSAVSPNSVGTQDIVSLRSGMYIKVP